MKRFKVIEINKETGAKRSLCKIFSKEEDAQYNAHILFSHNEDANIDYVVKSIPITALDCPKCDGRGVIPRQEKSVYFDGVIIPMKEVIMCDCCHGTGMKEYMLIELEEVGLWQYI